MSAALGQLLPQQLATNVSSGQTKGQSLTIICPEQQLQSEAW